MVHSADFGLTMRVNTYNTHIYTCILYIKIYVCVCSVTKPLQPHRLQHTRLPFPSPSPRVYSNSCPYSQWCHPTISSSVTYFSCPPPFPESGSFPVSQLFASGGQSIEASALASVLPVNIQCWFPLRLTALISLPSKGLSRVFSSLGESVALLALWFQICSF